jgi:hypothetical protein
MSDFQKVDSRYHELSSCLMDGLTDCFRERMEQVFKQVDLDIHWPAGGEFLYERLIRARVDHVYFYLSAPRGEDRILLYRFDVTGVDQFGAKFSERLTDKQIGHLLPWDKVELPIGAKMILEF